MPETFVDFLHFGEILLQSIDGIASFLSMNININWFYGDAALYLPEQNLSVLGLIFGAGLSALLTWRLIKFFLPT